MPDIERNVCINITNDTNSCRAEVKELYDLTVGKINFATAWIISNMMKSLAKKLKWMETLTLDGLFHYLSTWIAFYNQELGLVLWLFRSGIWIALKIAWIVWLYVTEHNMDGLWIHMDNSDLIIDMGHKNVTKRCMKISSHTNVSFLTKDLVGRVIQSITSRWK